MTVFTYDHPHRKTFECLTWLNINGVHIERVVAAPWEQRQSPPVFVELDARGKKYPHPRDMAEAWGYDYEVIPHTDVRGGDVGVILGAGVLPAEVVDSFSRGIINIHPGKLPDNRGLDNIKWAVVEGLPQVITAHWIDERIDRGAFICDEVVPVYAGDTLQMVHDRLMTYQAGVLLRALDLIDGIGKGTYHTTMDIETEKGMAAGFEAYKRNLYSV